MRKFFLATCCLGAEAVSPMTKDSSSTFKGLFMTEEEQSCDDISDTRSSETEGNDAIDFCTLPVPMAEVGHTLTFWGWDQNHGNIKGSVAISLVATDGESTNLKIIDVPDRESGRGGKQVRWYRYSFALNSTEEAGAAFLKMSYTVGGGGGHTLDLRDVWMRTTDEADKNYSSDRPQRMCSVSTLVTSIGIAALAGLCTIVALVTKKEWYAPGCIFVIVAFLILAEFVNEYPSPRCKGDAMFLVVMAFASFAGIFQVAVARLRRNGICGPFARSDTIRPNENSSGGSSPETTLVHAEVVELSEIVQAVVVEGTIEPSRLTRGSRKDVFVSTVVK